MFNWNLFFIIILICVPGILFLIPATKSIYKSINENQSKSKNISSELTFIFISIIQTLLFVGLASAVGVAAKDVTHLHAPFLEALSNNRLAWHVLQPQLMPAFLGGVGGAMILLIAYYFIFTPRLNKKTRVCMQNLRHRVGLGGRIFYGGVVEEVLCRWGLMTLFVWIGTLLLGYPGALVLWTSIILAGLLFGLAHLPALLSQGCERTPFFILTVITLNLWGSIIFGWLFWQYGLCAAIIAHALFHIIWYPFDYFSKDYEG